MKHNSVGSTEEVILRTVIIDDSGKKDWEQYIRDNPFSIAWQSYDWSLLLKKHYPVEFYPIAALDGMEIRGVLPLYRLKAFSNRDVLISVPYAVAGGIVADHDQAAQALLEKARELSGTYNDCAVTFKQYKKRIPGLAGADDNFYNSELNIGRNSDEIWKGLAERNKQMVEDASRYELTLDYPSLDVRAFYRLLLRHHHLRGVPCVSRKWIEDLIAFKMYSLALLKKGNELVAATMIKEFKDTVSFPFTCAPDASDRSMMFASKLYWLLIRRFAEEGMRIVHSGRIPNNDEADPYRLGWGGTRHQYYYQYLPDAGMKTEFDRKRGKKRKIIEACWRRLPGGMTAFLGPRIVKYFP